MEKIIYPKTFDSFINNFVVVLKFLKVIILLTIENKSLIFKISILCKIFTIKYGYFKFKFKFINMYKNFN